MTLGETRDLLNFKWGRTGFDYNEIGIQHAVDRVDHLKTIQKKQTPKITLTHSWQKLTTSSTTLTCSSLMKSMQKLPKKQKWTPLKFL